jgi:membrane protein DedA with SNARE-associated domain
MDPSNLLLEYGPHFFPYVVFICAMLENDITFVMAGIYAASARPHPDPWIGFLAAVAGAMCHDSFWFYLGRHRSKWIRSTSAWKRLGLQIEGWAERFGYRELFYCRFLPGTRNASLIFWGLHRMPYRIFVLIDCAGLAIWGAALTYFGYHFSLKAEVLLGRVKHTHLGRWLLVTAIITAVVYYAIRAFTRRRILERGHPPSDPRAD